MPFTITWDGNTNGRDTIDTNVWVRSAVSFYKVSDDVLTEAEFVDGKIVFSNGTEWSLDSFGDYGNGIVVAKSRVISGAAGTYHLADSDYFYITLPSDGTYFAVENNIDGTLYAYVESATFPNSASDPVPVPVLTERDLYRKINGQPTKLTLYKKLGGKLIPLDEHTKEVKT